MKKKIFWIVNFVIIKQLLYEVFMMSKYLVSSATEWINWGTRYSEILILYGQIIFISINDEYIFCQFCYWKK